MKILQVPLFLFLFFSVVHSKTHCPTSYCGNNSDFHIRYPFKLHGQQTPNCSYTNLTCSDKGIAILNLPSFGDFYVRYISYESSIIKLYDPQNCLPKRLMISNFSYSAYPFVAFATKNYTFYSCPSELIALSNLTTIDCLSNSSVATVASHAISSRLMKELYRCNEIVTSSIPVSGPDSPEFIGDQTDFLLEWFGPSCDDCPSVTGLVSDNMVLAAFMAMYLITVFMPLLICLGCCVHLIKTARFEVKTNNSDVA